MNSGPFLFLGLLVTMSISWITFIFGPQLQLGNLTPAKTVDLDTAVVDYPNNRPGMARQGEEVYRANGCVYCHTEQVRPESLGSDIARAWGSAKGDRYSVARDYIFDQTVMLGSQRIGPDLANAGARVGSTNAYSQAMLQRLWDPRIFQPDSVMTSYRYMFDVRKIGREPSPDALVVPPKFAAADGYEIIPRASALELSAYISSLREDKYVFEVPPPWEPPRTNAVAGTNAAAGMTNASSLSETNK